MVSIHLNAIQIKGLNKLGNVVIPGDSQLPKFSDLQVSGEVDRMLDYMNEDDLAGLKMVLLVFGIIPAIFIRLILSISEKAEGEGFIASQLRLVNIGLKGVPLTLYYSNSNEKSQVVHDILQWDAKINSVPEGEDEMETYTDTYQESKKVLVNGEKTAQSFARVAAAASKEIANFPVSGRLHFISKLREVIINKREKIIDQIQTENGKSRSDALISEIFGVLDYLHWLEKNTAKALEDEAIPTPIALLGKKSKIFYEPLGTILIISPWNYPFYQAIVPIATAFATGNAVIYKPSELTPLKGLVEELLNDSGFKSEWVQIAYGDGVMGKELIDQRPDKIFFTGSVATGKKIMAQASEQLIPVELELGGKDPTIVFEDANLERAVRGVLWGALTCSGQSCTSVEQIYVHENIYDSFREKLLKEVAKVRVGVDSNGEGEIGQMTSEAQVQIVANQLSQALDKGAKLIFGQEWDRQSKMIPPLVLENITEDMDVMQEETFGPMLPLYKFRSEQDLIDTLNKSKYGLSASIWSKDKDRCLRVARALKTGNVSINNVMLTEGNPALPFGGVKDSGIGRYKGVFGLHGFCHMKSVIIDSNSSKVEVNWFPYTEKKYKSFDKMMVSLFSGGVKNFINFALTGMGLESYSDKIAKK